MKTRQRSILLIGLLVLGIVALGCNITIPASGTAKPTAMPQEPVPGLAGKWQYFNDSGTLLYEFDITWTGQAYLVENCVGHDGVVCEIQSQTWDGTTLIWVNYFPNTAYTTEHKVVRVSGDELLVKRSGTGGVGETKYRRAP